MARTGDHPRRRAGLPPLDAPIVRAPAWLRRTALFILGAAAACAPAQPPALRAPAPATLAVITWNMHAGAGDLNRLVTDLEDGRLVSPPPADYVLLLQEAVTGGAHDPARLDSTRALSTVFEPARRTRTRTTGNAIVSTLPLARTWTVALPRERQPRVALAATVAVAGVSLFAVNAHFENRVSVWRGLIFSDSARGRQATALIAQLPAGPGIAGGDLNTWLGPAEPAWKAFAARFPDTPRDPSAPTFRDRLVLDHLFFDLPDGWRVDRRVLPSGYGSDHRPVLGLVTAASERHLSGARRAPSPGRLP